MVSLKSTLTADRTIPLPIAGDDESSLKYVAANAPAEVLPVSASCGLPITSPAPRAAAGGDVLHELVVNVKPVALGAVTVPFTILLTMVEFLLMTLTPFVVDPVTKIAEPGNAALLTIVLFAIKTLLSPEPATLVQP